MGFKKATEIERKTLVLNLVKSGRMDVKKAASLIGKLGSAKGGRVRAERLSPERRSEIARNAARARWKKYAMKKIVDYTMEPSPIFKYLTRDKK